MSEIDRRLAGLRDRLDALDEQIVKLINERAGLAQQIGKIKADAGVRVYAPDRERHVLDRVCTINHGPMPPEALRSVYRELMSASLALERSPRIAILGPTGSFSHQAARRRFGASVEVEPVATIAAIFDEVQRRRVEFGLVPVENSIVGGVGETLDWLIDRDVSVCGEAQLAVHLHLLGNGALDAVRRVYSKPEVFTQCQGWLTKTGLWEKIEPVASTSLAARRASEDACTAAIAGDLAAELFGLTRIAEFIEDDSGNVTRFLIIGTTRPRPTGADKTSMVFSVGHQPGRLAEVLEVFRDARVNMTRIESRPDRRTRWEYFFFVDVEGHADDAGLAAGLAEAAGRCRFWKVLGAYPRSDEIL